VRIEGSSTPTSRQESEKPIRPPRQRPDRSSDQGSPPEWARCPSHFHPLISPPNGGCESAEDMKQRWALHMIVQTNERISQSPRRSLWHRSDTTFFAS